MEASLSQDFQMGPGIVHRPRFRSNNHSWIPHLIGPAGVTDCFGCDGGAPFRGWIPPFGDLCVTPIAGDSVAEMPVIRIGEPPPLDSRLRGNDGFKGLRSGMTELGDPKSACSVLSCPPADESLGTAKGPWRASLHVSGIATHGDLLKTSKCSKSEAAISDRIAGCRASMAVLPYRAAANCDLSQETRTPTAMGQERS